ncbi:nitrilase family protein [Flavobacteriaceae bacterium Ap0902]|nr:nitrilase family protein [Flavobacteriaceae bacterium Ap0902]
MKNLTLALVELDIAWENPAQNFETLNQKIEGVGADIFFLPEMYSTGFTMNPEKIAEPEFGPSFKFLQEKAIEKNAVFVASIPTKSAGKYYNRLSWVEPNETFVQYDKRHLFTLVGEEKHYTAGRERKTIAYKNWKFMPQVCYDLRFPVWARNDMAYDLIFYVANWPEVRSYPWTQLLKARAIENQAYVVGVNRIGKDGNGIPHAGDSMVYDPLGKEVPHKEQNGILVFEVEKEILHKIRNKFKFLQDQDQFNIGD